MEKRSREPVPSFMPNRRYFVVLYIYVHVCFVGWSVVPCMVQGARADSRGKVEGLRLVAGAHYWAARAADGQDVNYGEG